MGAQARALMAGAMLAALLASAPAASAGTYEVTACDSDEAFAWTSWVKTTAASQAGDNVGVALADCPVEEEITGGIFVTTQYRPGDFDFARSRSVFASARLAPGGGYAAWTFTAPPGATVAAVEATASCRIPTGIVEGGFQSSSPGVLSGTCPPDRFDTVTYTPGAGSTFARIAVSCVAATYICGQNPHHVSMQHVSVTVDDPVAPTVTVTGGTLTAAGVRNGTQSVTFNASDNAGISDSRLFVDGTEVTQAVYPCNDGQVRPCNNLTGATLSFDTSMLVDGTHSFQVEVEDAAGNLTRSTARTFQTDHPGPQLTVTGELPDSAGEAVSEGRIPAHISAADSGSGVQRIRALVDGVAQPVFVNGVEMVDPTWTCPAGGCSRDVDYVFRADRFADGLRTVTIEASDYQGNARRRTIVVNNARFATCLAATGEDIEWCSGPDDTEAVDATADPADDPFDDIPLDFQACYDAYPGQPAYCTPDEFEDEGDGLAALGTTPQTRIYGIADENHASYLNPGFEALKVRRIRRILPYNIMRHLDLGTAAYPRPNYMTDSQFDGLKAAYNQFVATYDWAATHQPRKIEIMVSFEHRRDLRTDRGVQDAQFREIEPGNFTYRPSLGEYVRNVQRFRNRFPRVRIFSPWNEPNNSTQPTRVAKPGKHLIGYGPRRAAKYANAFKQRICKASLPSQQRCRIVAGELTDTAWRTYFDTFKAALDFIPDYWGVHAYADVRMERRKIANTRAADWIRKLPNGARIWFTEVGSRVDNERNELSDQRREVNYLVKRLAERAGGGINRLYYYQLCEPNTTRLEDPNPNDQIPGRERFDSGLFNRAIGCGTRRGSYYRYRAATLKNPYG